MALRGRRMVATAVSLTVASVGLGVAPAATAAAEPTIGLRAVRETIEVKRRPNRPGWFDPALHVYAKDGPFELRISRDYGEPMKLTRMLPGGGSQELSSDLLQGMRGLKGFVKLRVTNSKGKVVQRRSINFCPNSWEQQRVDDSGPMNQSYPYFCGGGPFIKGMVWGIDQGWGSSILEYGGVRLKGPNGRYTVTASIADKFVDVLGIPNELASAEMTVKLKTSKRGGGGCHHCGHRSKVFARQQRSADVPVIENPDPGILPDLAALPAFGMGVSNRKKQFLRFAATVWVDGASGLHVEGFRRPNEDVMDANQYFYENGEVVGKAPVGEFEYDARRGHTHWHFRQFAEYRLVSADGGDVVRSTKEAFCLAPTDPLDLTIDGADWRPDDIGFGSSNCGGESSLWVKEVLPLGWGDTYHQFRPGQSFNITNLPNGAYFIEVEANPGGFLHDADPSNNVERRKVIIKSKGGRRYVTVPPWNGIDTG
ncbi:MAG TPA: hypothetical protein VFD47_12820 [Actinomycetota bacterium]|nr:hypothetical protein [Actinomycetota bacterium]